ncbi:hypothetical protein B0T19DRAFT_403705 [Cercophora scortea]|uniref:Ketoreductase domain-containing protein n=1 Tax=Cercophora scortea TaxID=314031 RepID=A0AAE0I9M9_9PEZI|nr:hypothetical protein B0T19DRAFT_403705 [Cercophora scortea]
MSSLFGSCTKTNHYEPYPAIDPTRPELSTKGKNIVVTGGGTGIGQGIAEAFAKSGASNISLLSRREAPLASTKALLEAHYPDTKVHVFPVDLTDKAATDKTIADIITQVGRIDVLMANAGYCHDMKDMLEVDADDWFRTFEVNVKGNFNLLRAFLPHSTPGAAVIETTTILTVPAIVGFSGYGPSKFASHKLFVYLKAAHPELFVLSVHPGAVETDMLKKIPGKAPIANFSNREVMANFSVWAVSPEARFLDGKYIWAECDVDELKADAEAIAGTDKYTLGMLGWHDNNH